MRHRVLRGGPRHRPATRPRCTHPGIPGGRVIVGLDGVIDWAGEQPRITDASVFLTGPATRVAEIRLP